MGKKNLLSDITQSMKRDTLARAQAATQEQPPADSAQSGPHGDMSPIPHVPMGTSRHGDMGTRTNTNTKDKKEFFKKAAVRIEPEKYQEIKRFCLDNGMTFQGFIEKLIAEYFDNLTKSTKKTKGV